LFVFLRCGKAPLTADFSLFFCDVKSFAICRAVDRKMPLILSGAEKSAAAKFWLSFSRAAPALFFCAHPHGG
jgi:hypothetical protein